MTPKKSTISSYVYQKNIHFSEKQNETNMLKFKILNKKGAEPTYLWKYQSTPSLLPGHRLVRAFVARIQPISFFSRRGPYVI